MEVSKFDLDFEQGDLGYKHFPPLGLDDHLYQPPYVCQRHRPDIYHADGYCQTTPDDDRQK